MPPSPSQYLKDEALEFDTTDEMAALAADEEKVRDTGERVTDRGMRHATMCHS